MSQDIVDKTGVYYLTATDKGKPIASCAPEHTGWRNTDQIDWDSFHDDEGTLAALDHATASKFENIRVYHVVIGPELGSDEIRALRLGRARGLQSRGHKRTTGEEINGVWDGKRDALFVSYGPDGLIYYLSTRTVVGGDFNLYPVGENGIIDSHESHLDPEAESLRVIVGMPNGISKIRWGERRLL